MLGTLLVGFANDMGEHVPTGLHVHTRAGPARCFDLMVSLGMICVVESSLIYFLTVWVAAGFECALKVSVYLEVRELRRSIFCPLGGI